MWLQAYFENALSLAVVIFGVWQHESTIFAGVGTASRVVSASFIASLVLIGLDLLLLLHSSALVLPIYALTAASVHYQNPDSLLDYARKRGIRPDLIELLENESAFVRLWLLLRYLRSCAAERCQRCLCLQTHLALSCCVFHRFMCHRAHVCPLQRRLSALMRALPAG